MSRPFPYHMDRVKPFILITPGPPQLPSRGLTSAMISAGAVQLIARETPVWPVVLATVCAAAVVFVISVGIIALCR